LFNQALAGLIDKREAERKQRDADSKAKGFKF